MNADGQDDVLISAYEQSAVELFYGADTLTVAQTLEPTGEEAGFGYHLGGGGDLNGDGWNDLLIGTTGGVAYVYDNNADGTFSAQIELREDDRPSGFGTTVSLAGDLNGDGYEDAVIGASGAGAVYVYYGTSGGIISSPVQKIQSNAGSVDLFGYSVQGVGDTDADGYAELLIGAPAADNVGAVTLYMGMAAGVSPANTLVINGQDVGSRFGQQVSGAGDLNADGYADLLIGAPEGGERGVVYLYHGDSAGLNMALQLTVSLPEASSFGMALDGVGDVDQDGFVDVAIGDPASHGVFLFYGAVSGLSTTYTRLILPAVSGEHRIGTSVSGAGDLNADGYADLLVGSTSNAAWVVFGGLDADRDGYVGEDCDDTDPATFPGAAPLDAQDIFVLDCMTDADGDDYGDANPSNVVASPGTDCNDQDKNTFVSAAPLDDVNACMTDADGDDYGATAPQVGAVMGMDCDDNDAVLYPSIPFFRQVIFVEATSSHSTRSASGAGDFNGDGYLDVVVGAPGDDTEDTNSGAIYLYAGAADGLTTDSIKITIPGENGDDQYGFMVDGGQDINGDGLADIVATAEEARADETGVVYLTYGTTDATASAQRGVLFAGRSDSYSVALSRDLNGDGFAELLVGSPSELGDGHGAVYLFYGGADGISAEDREVFSGEPGEHFGSTVREAGDLNGDSFIDILIGENKIFDGTVTVLYSSEAGFSTQRLTPTDAATWFGIRLDGAGDINGDGYDDAAMVSGPEDLHLFYGSPIGLINEQKLSYVSLDIVAQVSAAGDVDQDGFADVLFGHDGSVSLYYGAAAGLEETPLTWLVNLTTPYLRDAGDLNTDGAADFLMAAARSDGITVFYGSPFRDNLCDCDPSLSGVDTTLSVWNVDADGDSYGSTTTGEACTQPAHYTTNSDDCDDTDPSIYPGAPEIADDDIDQDCDGTDSPHTSTADSSPTDTGNKNEPAGCGCGEGTPPSLAALLILLGLRRVQRR